MRPYEQVPITDNVTKGGRVGRVKHKKHYWKNKWGNQLREEARMALRNGDTRACKTFMRDFRYVAWGPLPGGCQEPTDPVLIIAKELHKAVIKYRQKRNETKGGRVGTRKETA